MKIAIAGKGGAGKTTLCAALARAFARQGRQVMAVDADPNNCLGPALGLSEEASAAITPICEMRELLCERAGTAQGGGFFSLSPEVADLVERFSVTSDGVRLLVMGTITSGGSGCVCPESAVLRALTREVVTAADAVLLLDMEAGIEHLGRGTARHMDALVIVVEPTQASARTAERIVALGADLGLRAFFVVGNKVRTRDDSTFIRERVSPPVIGHLPFVEGMGSVGCPAPGGEYLDAIEEVKHRLERDLAGSAPAEES